MGFEDTARKAGLDLQETTHPDVEAALAEFQRAVPRRRRARTSVAAIAVAAALVVAVAASRSLLPDDSRNLQPAQPPGTASPSASSDPSGYGCEHPLITCYGDRRSAVAMIVPMQWTIPRSFNMPYSGDFPTSSWVETYTRRGVPGGVTVVEGVSAADTQSEPVPAPGAATAESLANWLAQRPFLSSSQVRNGRVDGHPAWIVDTAVRPGAPAGPATCNRTIDCYPMMLAGDHMFGIWGGLTNRYTVLDLPGAGLTVVWSWGIEGELPPAATDIIASIRFD